MIRIRLALEQFNSLDDVARSELLASAAMTVRIQGLEELIEENPVTFFQKLAEVTI